MGASDNGASGRFLRIETKIDDIIERLVAVEVHLREFRDDIEAEHTNRWSTLQLRVMSLGVLASLIMGITSVMLVLHH